MLFLPLEERLTQLYNKIVPWTGRPSHRQVYMYAVSMLAYACKPENVPIINILADLYDKRFSERNACWEAPLSWVQESDDRAVLDGYMLYNWCVNTDGPYGSVSTMPHELYIRQENRIRRKYQRDVERVWRRHYVLGMPEVKEHIEPVSDELDLEIFRHGLSLGILYDCAFSGRSRSVLLACVQQLAGGQLVGQLLALADVLRPDPTQSIRGMYADMLEDLGASEAAVHMRQPLHCRACWAVITQRDVKNEKDRVPQPNQSPTVR